MNTYLSPLHFLPKETDLKDVSAKELLLAKKKLLAEIELSSDKTIILNKTVCTRNDVLKLFDQLLDDEKDLNYHFAIFKNKVLLEFLENRFVAILPLAITDNLKNNTAFITFISPYFEKVYTPLFIKCIKQLRLAEINILAANSCLMNYAGRDKSYKAVHALISKYIYEIELHTQKINAQKVVEHSYFVNLINFFIPKNYKVSEFKQYYDSTLIEILNLLPERFNDLRTEYCSILGDMVASLNRCQDLKSGLSIIKNIRTLQCNDDIRQWVEEWYHFLLRNSDPFFIIKELYIIFKDSWKELKKILKE